MNVGNFDRQAADAHRAVVAEATETIRTVALDLFHSLQTRRKDAGGAWGSPVASGRLVSSYRISINSIDASSEPADPNYRYPPAGYVADHWVNGVRGFKLTGHMYDEDNLPPRTIRNGPISRVSARLRTFKLGDRIYIANSVPYIRRIEIGSHSWQTPDGVFAPTVREVVRKYANINLKVRYV